MSKAPTYLLTVAKGALVPDARTVTLLRAKGYRMGDELSATLRKARSPGFHRLAHRFGTLVAENLDAFEGLDGHAVLKRLQIEGNVACDDIPLNFPGVGPCSYRVPRSLSFDNMDELEFRPVFYALCQHVAKTYWKDCTPEQIEAMASAMPEAA